MDIRLIFRNWFNLFECTICFGIGRYPKGYPSEKNVDRNDKKRLNFLAKTAESEGP